MAADDLMQIRITADFKEAEGAFLKMAKVATAFETDFRRISSGLNKEFNKINGMAELFGNSTNVVKDKMDALKRSMEQLMTLGLQPMNPEVQKLKAQYDALAASIVHTTQETTKVSKATKQAGDSVKKSNMQWTNWALVLQDLPYGFRGIQNNLPALMGGIAGMAGPLYLVGSAIIALFTAWDQGSFKAEQAIDRVAEAHKRNTEVLTKGAEAEAEALVEMRKMATVFDGVRDGSITAEDALRTYNETYGETWGIAKGVNEAEDSFIKKSSAYVKATALRAMANEKYAQAQEAFKTGRLAAGEDQTSFLMKFAAGMDALEQVGIMGLDGVSLTKFAKAFTKNYAETQKVLVNDIKNLSGSAFEMLMSQGDEFLKEANKELSNAGIKPTGKGKKGTTTTTKDTYLLDSLRAKQKAYKDDIYEFRAYGILIINEEERLAVARAKKEGTYLQNKKELHARYQADRLTNNNLFEQNLNKVLDDNEKIRTAQEKKELQIQVDNRLDIAHAILAINKMFASEDAKIADREFKNKMSAISNELKAKLKANRKDPRKQAVNYADAITSYTELGKQAGLTAEQVDAVGDAINSTNAAAQGTIEAFTPLSDILNQLATGVLVEIGTQLGNLFSGESFSMDGFLSMIANALIQLGTHLVTISGLFKAFDLLFASGGALFGMAIPIGLAAIAIGTALKSSIGNKSKPKAFANGGIVSGPTMGLMGEYPGAKTNPEVVAPLDKLKSMIGSGSGSGEFVLRGNDLILAIQRSNSSLKLRRG